MTLRRGDRGSQVKQLQADLAAAGYPVGQIDGIFGRQTEAAVKSLQESQGLAVDGIVGPKTAAALAALADADADTDDALQHDEDETSSTAAGPDVPSVPTAFPGFFDNWGGELASRYREAFYLHEASGRRVQWKGRPTPVDLSLRTHICMHITAVEFGTAARKRRQWRERITAGQISEETLSRYDTGNGDVDATAERMALHERFWPVAYHWVGLRNGDVLFNNAPERYTYHGNRSNRFAIGVSAEAKLPARETGRTPQHTPVDDHFIETNRAMLRLAITTSRDAGAPLTHVTAHRCFSTKRTGDPGEAVWREVVLPVCADLDVTVDYDLVNGGRAIPIDWDPAARADWNGRPLH